MKCFNSYCFWIKANLARLALGIVREMAEHLSFRCSAQALGIEQVQDPSPYEWSSWLTISSPASVEPRSSISLSHNWTFMTHVKGYSHYPQIKHDWHSFSHITGSPSKHTVKISLNYSKTCFIPYPGSSFVSCYFTCWHHNRLCVINLDFWKY